jgi:hypothetical protein
LFGRLSRFPFVFKETRHSHRTGCSLNEPSLNEPSLNNEEPISELAAGHAALLDLGTILGQNLAFNRLLAAARRRQRGSAVCARRSYIKGVRKSGTISALNTSGSAV